MDSLAPMPTAQNPALVPTQGSGLEALAAALTGNYVAPEYVYTIPAPQRSAFKTEGEYEDACLDYAAQVSSFLAGQADYKAGESVGEVIEARHFFAHPTTIHETDADGNETGEMIASQRIVIIDAEGKTYECQSQGILQSLLAIWQLPGIGTPDKWKRPLRMTIRQIEFKGRGGARRMFKLQVLAPNQSSARKR